jgi:hypothetical protein
MVLVGLFKNLDKIFQWDDWISSNNIETTSVPGTCHNQVPNIKVSIMISTVLVLFSVPEAFNPPVVYKTQIPGGTSLPELENGHLKMVPAIFYQSINHVTFDQMHLITFQYLNPRRISRDTCNEATLITFSLEGWLLWEQRRMFYPQHKRHVEPRQWQSTLKLFIEFVFLVWYLSHIGSHTHKQFGIWRRRERH